MPGGDGTDQDGGQCEPLQLLALCSARPAVADHDRERREENGSKDHGYHGDGRNADRPSDLVWVVEEENQGQEYSTRRGRGPGQGPPPTRGEPPRGEKQHEQGREG